MSIVIPALRSYVVVPQPAGLLYRVRGHRLVIKNQNISTIFKHNGLGGIRGEILEFSENSRRRMLLYLNNASSSYANFGTLTYPNVFPQDGAVVKEHLRKFLQTLKRNIAQVTNNAPPSVFWFLEFQKRGAPHFHFFTTGHPMPTIQDSRKFIAELWASIVKSSDPNHLKAGTQYDKFKSKKGAAGYAAKSTTYAAKSTQKDVPKDYINVGRFWGVVGVKNIMVADIVLKKHETCGAGIRFVNKLKKMIEEGQIVEKYRANGYRQYEIVDKRSVFMIMDAMGRTVEHSYQETMFNRLKLEISREEEWH